MFCVKDTEILVVICVDLIDDKYLIKYVGIIY